MLCAECDGPFGHRIAGKSAEPPHRGIVKHPHARGAPHITLRGMADGEPVSAAWRGLGFESFISDYRPNMPFWPAMAALLRYRPRAGSARAAATPSM